MEGSSGECPVVYRKLRSWSEKAHCLLGMLEVLLQSCPGWFVCFSPNLTQLKSIGKRELPSLENMPPSDCHVGKSMGAFFGLMIDEEWPSTLGSATLEQVLLDCVIMQTSKPWRAVRY